MRAHLVLPLQLKHARQVEQSSLHGVKTFNDDEDLLPRAMRLGLALADTLLQQGFQSVHVVMLEHPDVGAAETDTESNRRVVELV